MLRVEQRGEPGQGSGKRGARAAADACWRVGLRRELVRGSGRQEEDEEADRLGVGEEGERFADPQRGSGVGLKGVVS